jgi:hypothetical protein
MVISHQSKPIASALSMNESSADPDGQELDFGER